MYDREFWLTLLSMTYIFILMVINAFFWQKDSFVLILGVSALSGLGGYVIKSLRIFLSTNIKK